MGDRYILATRTLFAGTSLIIKKTKFVFIMYSLKTVPIAQDETVLLRKHVAELARLETMLSEEIRCLDRDAVRLKDEIELAGGHVSDSDDENVSVGEAGVINVDGSDSDSDMAAFGGMGPSGS